MPSKMVTNPEHNPYAQEVTAEPTLYLTLEEQKVFHDALRRSAQLVHKAKETDDPVKAGLWYHGWKITRDQWQMTQHLPNLAEPVNGIWRG
jgi:hypothetical protein